MAKDFDSRVDELIDKVQYPQSGAGEYFIPEGSPWSPENERVARNRIALTHLAEEIRYRANAWWELSPEQKNTVLRAADMIEKAA